jgi:hypothetical protein
MREIDGARALYLDQNTVLDQDIRSMVTHFVSSEPLRYRDLMLNRQSRLPHRDYKGFFVNRLEEPVAKLVANVKKAANDSVRNAFKLKSRTGRFHAPESTSRSGFVRVNPCDPWLALPFQEKLC